MKMLLIYKYHLKVTFMKQRWRYLPFAGWNHCVGFGLGVGTLGIIMAYVLLFEFRVKC